MSKKVEEPDESRLSKPGKEEMKEKQEKKIEDPVSSTSGMEQGKEEDLKGKQERKIEDPVSSTSGIEQGKEENLELKQDRKNEDTPVRQNICIEDDEIPSSQR
ncbi:cilia- and flagella-associated protein 251-like [Saccostrea echinata]|uniref:cilia- and flagella-associated protein 251-like n=1 Tax=Saccostrea echinata TaxID=191078 RepID=UPI002A8020B1|nr:cilia- and flagella-associated protein 251-like [Saccostrea echinata]